MTEDLQDKILNVIQGFRNWGYNVGSEPIPGEEALYLSELRKGLEKVEEHVAYLQRTYKVRWRSKRCVAYLHTDMPEPCWGVELLK